MFKIKFPTKCIFWIFPILRITGIAPFCNLLIEWPSYFILFGRFCLVQRCSALVGCSAPIFRIINPLSVWPTYFVFSIRNTKTQRFNHLTVILSAHISKQLQFSLYHFLQSSSFGCNFLCCNVFSCVFCRFSFECLSMTRS